MLGSNIKSLRALRGINQEDLGKRIGVSKQSVSNWENENILPSIEMLVRIADFFGVTTDFLLGRSEHRTLDTSGLGDEELSHLQVIIDDMKKRAK